MEKQNKNQELDYALILKYKEGIKDETERETAEKYLNENPTALAMLADLAREGEITELSDMQKAEVANSLNLDYQEMGRWAAEINEKINPPPDIPRIPAWANVAAAVVVVFLNFPVANYYINDPIRHIYDAQEKMQEKHEIHIRSSRISGNYLAEVSIDTMSNTLAPGSEDPRYAYLRKAREDMEAAIRKGDTSIKGKLLLAHILMAQKEYEPAKDILQELVQRDTVSAAVLNDMGALIYRYEKDYKTAIDYFNRALAKDTTFSEAYFNLARANIRLKNKAAAMAAIEKFRKTEKDRDWRRVASELKIEANRLPDTEN